MTGEPAVSSSGDAVRSTALSSKCRECHVVSCWRRKLNTDLLIRGDKNGRKNLAKVKHVVINLCAFLAYMKTYIFGLKPRRENF